jgi:hypothetical protein
MEASTASHSRADVRATASSSGPRSPHVLDGDHRLVGEGPHQGDLLVAEWSDLAAPRGDHADEGILPQQRDGEDRPHVLAPIEVERLG